MRKLKRRRKYRKLKLGYKKRRRHNRRRKSCRILKRKHRRRKSKKCGHKKACRKYTKRRKTRKSQVKDKVVIRKKQNEEESWVTKSFIRCKSCGQMQMRDEIIRYWCSPEDQKTLGKKRLLKLIMKSTCRFCGNRIDGK